jgi:hypothetical protein
VSGSAKGTDLSKSTAFAQMRLPPLDSFGWEDISHHSLTPRHQARQFVTNNCLNVVTNLDKDRILVVQTVPEHDHLTEPISRVVLAIKTVTMTTKRGMVSGIRGSRREGAHRSKKKKKVKCHHCKRPPFASIICQFNPAHTLHSMTYIPVLHCTVFNQSPFRKTPSTKCTHPGHITRQPRDRRQNQTPQFYAVKIKFGVWTLTVIKGLITG